MLSETLDLSSSKESFEDFYAYLQDYHRTGLEEDLQKLSLKFTGYTFLLREYPIELNSVSFDFYLNGKHFRREMDIETPIVSEADFD